MIVLERPVAAPSASPEDLVEQGVCPECMRDSLALKPMLGNSGWEVVCTRCGLICSDAHPLKAPTWLPYHSPVSSLAFGNSLGGTLSLADAKKILATSSRNTTERRNAWWRAKSANAQFGSKTSPVETQEVRKLKTIGKVLLQKWGLDTVGRINDPLDFSHVLASTYGRALKKIGSHFQEARDRHKRSQADLEAVAEAALFVVLLSFNPLRVHNPRYRWRFTVEDLELVKDLI